MAALTACNSLTTRTPLLSLNPVGNQISYPSPHKVQCGMQAKPFVTTFRDFRRIFTGRMAWSLPLSLALIASPAAALEGRADVLQVDIGYPADALTATFKRVSRPGRRRPSRAIASVVRSRSPLPVRLARGAVFPRRWARAARSSKGWRCAIGVIPSPAGQSGQRFRVQRGRVAPDVLRPQGRRLRSNHLASRPELRRRQDRHTGGSPHRSRLPGAIDRPCDRARRRDVHHLLERHRPGRHRNGQRKRRRTSGRLLERFFHSRRLALSPRLTRTGRAARSPRRRVARRVAPSSRWRTATMTAARPSGRPAMAA